MTDLKAAEDEAAIGLGPIGQAVVQRAYDRVHLLNNLDPAVVDCFVEWLASKTSAPLVRHQAALQNPTHIGDIYRACRTVLLEVQEKDGPVERTYHLSPGTPAMAAVWILLAKSRFPAELINSSKDHGVQRTDVPFDIAAEFLPDFLHEPDEHLVQLSAGLPPEAPEFGQIVHRSAGMRRVVAQARRIAPRRIPVLIEGASGTGKELLARAIHRASPRAEKPFVAVNCGALPENLVESLLFGHEKGAFTGAHRAQIGCFEQADGGTLFLDEIGELPLPTQVKLLRVLQEEEITPIGASRPKKVDARIIAATNRNLVEEVAAGRFREDLYYRIGVAILRLPPLREREGDVKLLIAELLKQVNAESETEPGYVPRQLSAGAQRALLAHTWPGNVRELLNVLRRAAVWSAGETITEAEIKNAMLPVARGCGEAEVLGRPLGNGFSLLEVLHDVERHYLERAWEQGEGVKARVTELLGASNYQTVSNWLKRHGIGPKAEPGTRKRPAQRRKRTRRE